MPCILTFLQAAPSEGRVTLLIMGSYLPRVAMVLRTPGCGLHTVQGDIDPGDHRFRPRFVGVVNVWNDL